MATSPSVLASNNPYTTAANGPGAGFQDPTKKAGLSHDIGNTLWTNNAQQQNTQDQRNQETSSLFPQYKDMLNSGYSPNDQSAIEQGTTGGVQGAFSGARAGAANREARTNNSAGYGSFMGDLAQKQGQQVSQANQSNKIAFAQERQSRRMAGLEGISKLYGVDTSFLNSLGNQNLGALGLGNDVQARSRGVLGTIGAGLGLAKSVFNLGSGVGTAISGGTGTGAATFIP